jgi:dTDP-4-dehydrorhamnose 3,5-epimerase
MIAGVLTKKLRVIPDERGFLMEILRNDDELFEAFGQVYMSVALPGVVKGWHYHRQQTDNMTVVQGMAKIVLYDMREDSATHGEVNEFFVGERNPILIKIPAGVAHGMKGLAPHGAYMINIPTRVYQYDDPDELRLHPHDNDIPYDWSHKDG